MGKSTHSSGYLISLYKGSQGWLKIVFTLLQSGFNGVWLGLLSPQQLQQYTEMHYDGINLYKDDDYILRGLFDWEKTCIEKYFQGLEKILLTGAGSGRETLALSRMGYSVDAFECNPTLVNHGNDLFARMNIAARIELCACDVAPRTGKMYDGVIAGWGMYALIQGRARRIAFLRQLRAQCAAGAPLLLSFFTRKDDRFRYRFTRRVANIFRWLLRRERVEVGDELMPDYIHNFIQAEIAAEMEAAGFQLVYYDTEEYGQAIGLAVGGS